MVHAAESDIVTPTVAADDPLRFFHEILFPLEDLLAGIAAAGLHHRNEFFAGCGTQRAAVFAVNPLLHRSLQLSRAATAVGDGVLHLQGHALAQFLHTKVHTQAELGIVLKQRIGPCRTLTLAVGRVRGRRCRTAVDRRTTRSVGNHHPVSEHLRDQFDVRRLAATGTSTRELEERLCELAVFHSLGLVDHGILVTHVFGQVIPVFLLVELRFERLHHQSLGRSRTDIGAVATAGAVQRADLDPELVSLRRTDTLQGRHALGSGGNLFVGQQERTDHSVRADIGALITLDTVLAQPLRNVHGDTTLLVSSGPGIPRTVFAAEECAHRQIVALKGVDRTNDFRNEFGNIVGSGTVLLDRNVGPFCRNFHLVHFCTALIDSGVVHAYDLLAFFAVSLVDRFLHLLDGFVERNHVRDLEEGTLHNRIRAAAQSEVHRDLRRVDDVEVDLVLGQVFLHVVGQRLLGRLGIVDAVEQERTAFFQSFEHIVFIDVRRYVAGYEVGGSDQVRRRDRFVAEAQVR